MKHGYLFCFLCLSCLVGFGQNNRAQSLSLGVQMPASRVFDPTSGENLLPTAFPLTVGYSITLKENHVIGLVAGGRWANSRTLLTNPDSVVLPAFWGIETRIDYRWFFAGTNQVLQPFIGGGIKTSMFFYEDGLPRNQFTTVAIQSIFGLQVKLSERFFIQTEIPVTLWQPNGVNLWELSRISTRPGSAIGSFFRAQQNQLWPVISIGVNL